MIVIGIDPGARDTGIAVVAFDGNTPALVSHCTVSRDIYAEGVYLPVAQDYLERIYAAIAAESADIIGVEGVVPPNLHMGRAAFKTSPILATAIVSGYCQSFGKHGRIIVVPPDGNGAGPLGAYPTTLVSPRERTHIRWRTNTGDNNGQLRHERSAYDVARIAHRLSHAHLAHVQRRR